MNRSRNARRALALSSLTLAAGLACGSAFAATAATDTGFVQKAAMGGIAEVEAGKLAQDKGASADVKQFGARMVADHGKANDELKSIASGKSIAVPADTDARHKKAKAMLEAKAGTSFDAAYKAQMVADHKETIALFEKEAKSGKDAELKAFAAKMLPDLKDHLKMAQMLK